MKSCAQAKSGGGECSGEIRRKLVRIKVITHSVLSSAMAKETGHILTNRYPFIVMPIITTDILLLSSKLLLLISFYCQANYHHRYPIIVK
jgi:hypothetical protein